MTVVFFLHNFIHLNVNCGNIDIINSINFYSLFLGASFIGSEWFKFIFNLQFCLNDNL